MDKHYRIADLIVEKLKGNISAEDNSELQFWLDESEDNQDLFDKVNQDQYLLDKLSIYELFNNEKAWASLESKLPQSKVVKFSSPIMLRYAASILLPLVLISSLLYFYLETRPQDSLANVDETIHPGTQKATLILSDGEQVDLQHTDAPKTIQQGIVQVKNQNQTLAYSIDEEEPVTEQAPVIYNELITPRGGNYNLTLEDGTTVWLNAASTLKFPVAFTDTIRQVYLVGEAYFDVSHDGKPFIVSTDERDIRVLGTSFNVSAYTDESNLITTLVEGSVMLQTPTTAEVLKPNDQAIVSFTDDQIEITTVNTSIYTSWVDGKIEFSYDNMEAVMRKLSRWYDFEYTFENLDAQKFHFSASLDNSENISAILEMIKLTTDINLKLEDNTIVIQ
ncbi:MAG: FecR domain-containing protein [Cyclobacteriaceae bacterium]